MTNKASAWKYIPMAAHDKSWVSRGTGGPAALWRNNALKRDWINP